MFESLTELIGVPQNVADCVVTNSSTFGLPTSFVLGGKQAAGQDRVRKATRLDPFRTLPVRDRCG